MKMVQVKKRSPKLPSSLPPPSFHSSSSWLRLCSFQELYIIRDEILKKTSDV